MPASQHLPCPIDPALLKKELRVLDIVQSYSSISGGVKRYIQDKMKAFSRCDNLRHTLIIPGKEDKTYEDRNTRIFEVKSPPLIGSKSYRVLLSGERIREIVHMARPHVIEVGNAYWPAWVAVEIGEERDIPVVGFYHSDYPRAFGVDLGEVLGSETVQEWVTGAIETYLAKLYNRMTVTVTATRHFETLLREAGVESLARVPLCTDTEIFRPMDSRSEVFSELGLDQDTCLLAFIGRFAPMKNLEPLLEAMSLLENDKRAYHLLMVGDGEERDKVEKAANKRDDITWLGYAKDQDTLASYYSGADLFVNPGTHETFGLVSLEAQACGTRVLGVRGGGMDETLEGEEPLIMAEAPQAEELARAIREIADLQADEEARQRRRRRRRQRMEDHFSLTSTFNRLGRLYAGLRDGTYAAGDFLEG